MYIPLKRPSPPLLYTVVPIKIQRVSIFLPSRTATNILLFLVPQASPSSPSPSQSGHRCISYCYSCGCRGFKASDHTPRPPHLTTRHHASAHYTYSSALHHSTPHCTSLHHTIPQRTSQCCTSEQCTILNYTTPFLGINQSTQHHTTPHFTTSHCTILRHRRLD